jgi:hypothetical protein
VGAGARCVEGDPQQGLAGAQARELG